EQISASDLLALAAPGEEITFTMVPLGSQERIGIDRDGDRSFDRDELDQCGDPADANAGPGHFRPADSNCDGAVNNFDIDAFVLALTNRSAYEQGYAACNFLCNNDINHDGLVNNFDIDPFVVCLVNSGCP